jgi:hypothetical protein
MKRLMIASLALALSACAGLVSPGTLAPPSPASIADKTRLDEQGPLALTLAYRVANRLGVVALRTGIAKGAKGERIKALDRDAFAWVERARAAYLAGNAASYAEAALRARSIIAEITQLAS